MKTLKNLFLSLILTSLSFISFGQVIPFPFNTSDFGDTVKIKFFNNDESGNQYIKDSTDAIYLKYIPETVSHAQILKFSVHDTVYERINPYTDTNTTKIMCNTSWTLIVEANYNVNDTILFSGNVQGVYTSIIFYKETTVAKVNNVSKISNLSIYPNPVTDILNINFESNEPINVAVTDMNGSIVYSETASFATKVDMTMLPSGMYFVKIGNENTKVFKQ